MFKHSVRTHLLFQPFEENKAIDFLNAIVAINGGTMNTLFANFMPPPSPPHNVDVKWPRLQIHNFDVLFFLQSFVWNLSKVFSKFEKRWCLMQVSMLPIMKTKVKLSQVLQVIWIILDHASNIKFWSHRRHIDTPDSNLYCSCSFVFCVPFTAKLELKINCYAFVAIVRSLVRSFFDTSWRPSWCPKCSISVDLTALLQVTGCVIQYYTCQWYSCFRLP